MRIAGYHGDKKSFTRLIVESHINREECYRAWRSGEEAKSNGIVCSCIECEKEKKQCQES